MKRLAIFALILSVLFLFGNSFDVLANQEPFENASEKFEKKFKLSAGYDCWYAYWDVYVPDPEYIEFHDYDIDPTIINGFFATASYGKSESGSWNFLVNVYGDYIKNKQREETDEKAAYFQALLSYGLTDDKRIVTKFQRGDFEGELVGQYQFKTDWVKMEMLLMQPTSIYKDSYWVGWGLRYTRYSMPLEFVHYAKVDDDEDEYEDIGHEVIQTKTSGVSFVLKTLDPMIFGYDNPSWFFIDGDIAFGISFAEAEEFKEDVYGFQFNSELNIGIKHSFKIRKGLIALKLGYSVLFDAQILSEWDNDDNKSTSGTIRNFFHGPFVTIMGSF